MVVQRKTLHALSMNWDSDVGVALLPPRDEMIELDIWRWIVQQKGGPEA
ncbi:hypothetical protein CGLO_13296 [Colletotrichum gloeosporioides Cg-14]|uniref:Uncharacterized protein n=1 Tax=Colletotrichum gloeosporioides (strain Cg-14) TaxID=1237896 RepID=T0L7F1_COLGC|nr:hypothetical protein CGLO_13296 [Colletotrichum gloeosporioides Cg-14]